MKRLIIEIKAKSNNQDRVREILKLRKADFKGTDHQIDTYFNVNYGRLKLREGRIESSLVFYDRENEPGPKQSNVTLFEADPESPLKEILTKALGILVVVDKHREIYFIDNVKFHIDTVEKLGTFIEIEAIAKDNSISKEKLLEQCQSFMDLFQISQEDLISVSYSDLLVQKYIDTST
ncbi:MAG TPA: class IV adenylate cyclase [Dehalococcoidia bacterium]|nr:class IV adenylate cyclase [Dehalococcoidia bacterium]